MRLDRKARTVGRVSSLVLGTVWFAVVGLVAGCGGGGSGSDAATQGNLATAGTGTTPNRCAPDLCLGFSYPSASLSQGMVYRIDPLSRDALVGHRAHYQLTGGSLPAGLRLDEASGAITGIPTVLGEFSYDVQLTVDGYRGSLSTHVLGLVSAPALSPQARQPQPDQGGMTPGFPVGLAVDGRLSLGFAQSSNNGPAVGSVDVPAPPGVQGHRRLLAPPLN